jgi:hypothetical protein
MEQRERFTADDRRGLYARAELCARYGISRKTGYKWLERFAENRRRGLWLETNQGCPNSPYHRSSGAGRARAPRLSAVPRGGRP